MIVASTPKEIRVMFTPFRDGLQSSFGGKVRLQDFLPAVKASAEIGIRHFEFGGGARFQAPYRHILPLPVLKPVWRIPSMQVLYIPPKTSQ